MELEDIPAEVRWEIATRTSQSLSVGYGMAFRQILDEETVKQVEKAIWTEGGKEVKAIANILGLPSKNAIEVNDAWGIVGMIIMGEWEYKTQEANNDCVIGHLTSCPNLNTHREMNAPIISMPDLCQAYCTGAVESLNPKYTQKFTKRMCTGDSYCESIVGLKK